MTLPLIVACLISGILLGINAYVVRLLSHDKIWISTVLVGGSFTVLAGTIAWLMNGFNPPSWWTVGYIATVWIIAVPISNHCYRHIPIVAGICAGCWAIVALIYVIAMPH